MRDYVSQRNYEFAAAHIPGVSNKEADKHSWFLDDTTDQQLNQLLKESCENSVTSYICLFVRVSISS